MKFTKVDMRNNYSMLYDLLCKVLISVLLSSSHSLSSLALV